MPSGPTRSSLQRSTRAPAMRTLKILALAVLAGACGAESAPSGPTPDSPGDGPNPPTQPAPVPPGTFPPGAAVNERIAFTSTRDGEPFIYLATADGSGVRRLAKGEKPGWSPDGRRIAFHARGPEAGDLYGIRVINADGSHERVVAQHGVNPAWSPDGRRIVFSSGSGLGGGIFVVNDDGSGLTLLLSHLFDDPTGADWLGMPSWSPDGKTIAFVRASYERGWQIFLMNADGTAPRPLTGANAYSDPSWSPDGSRIAFRDVQTIATTRADGSDYQLHELRTGFDPDWSPEGRSLVFNAFASSAGDANSPLGSRMRIFTLDRVTGAVRQLIPDAVAPALPDYRDDSPAWVREDDAAAWRH